MPRFYFNVYDGSNFIDDDGTEFDDLPSVPIEAIKLAGNLIAENASRIRPGEEWRLEVTNEEGVALFDLEFVVREKSAAVWFNRTA